MDVYLSNGHVVNLTTMQFFLLIAILWGKILSLEKSQMFEIKVKLEFTFFVRIFPVNLHTFG